MVVDRDPRDHYVETIAARIRRGEKAPSAHAWSVNHTKIREQYKIRRDRYAQKNDHRFIEMKFEDFVTDYEKQAELINAELGILDADLVKQNFDPQVSIKNIGKHFSELGDDDRRTISSELRTILHPAASKHR